MKISRTVCITAIVALAACGAYAQGTCGGHASKDSMMVSTAWLAQHLNDPDLVLLSVGEKSEYEAGHIPGARWIDYHETHAMTGANGLSVELLPMAEAAKLFASVGVGNGSHIVLYRSKDWTSPTTRIYLTLDAMGLGARTAILDGGFELWTAEGRAVTKDVPSVKPTTLDTCPPDDDIATLDDVKAAIHHPGVALIDARTSEFYSGKTASNGRKGHIPGAGSLPYPTLYDDKGKLKSRDQLAAMFQSAGMKPGDKLILYCHIGQQATAVWFAARYMGYDAKLFDGSWEEWSNHKELPVEAGDAH